MLRNSGSSRRGMRPSRLPRCRNATYLFLLGAKYNGTAITVEDASIVMASAAGAPAPVYPNVVIPLLLCDRGVGSSAAPVRAISPRPLASTIGTCFSHKRAGLNCAAELWLHARCTAVVVEMLRTRSGPYDVLGGGAYPDLCKYPVANAS